MKVTFSVVNDDQGEEAFISQSGVETVEDMLHFFQRCFEVADYNYIHAVGAASADQHLKPKEWWSTF